MRTGPLAFSDLCSSNAHVQSTNRARLMPSSVKLHQGLRYMSASSKGYVDTTLVHRLIWAFACHLCDKYFSHKLVQLCFQLKPLYALAAIMDSRSRTNKQTFVHALCTWNQLSSCNRKVFCKVLKDRRGLPTTVNAKCYLYVRGKDISAIDATDPQWNGPIVVSQTLLLSNRLFRYFRVILSQFFLHFWLLKIGKLAPYKIYSFPAITNRVAWRP